MLGKCTNRDTGTECPRAWDLCHLSALRGLDSNAASSCKGGARVSGEETSANEEEHFRPVGTLFVLAVFVITLILLWASVYVILLSRGVTV